MVRHSLALFLLQGQGVAEAVIGEARKFAVEEVIKFNTGQHNHMRFMVVTSSVPLKEESNRYVLQTLENGPSFGCDAKLAALSLRW
jgi:hypothetical protein